MKPEDNDRRSRRLAHLKATPNVIGVDDGQGAAAQPNDTVPWTNIDAARAGVSCLRVRPVGSMTVGEYAQRYRLSLSSARAELRRFVAQGKIKVIKARTPLVTCYYVWIGKS